MEPISMHKINDYLNQHPDLTHAEFRIAYFVAHSDYGKQKDGRFWYGAEAIAEKVHCDRSTVVRALQKFERLGWMTTLEGERGRAKVRRVEYERLWNEAQGVPHSSTSPAASSNRGVEPCGRGAAPTHTNPPKEASKRTRPSKPPKISDRVARDRVSEMGVEKEEDPVLPDVALPEQDQVQGKTISAYVERAQERARRAGEPNGYPR